uniref:Putative secreted protein n=1 Tax=Anopheles darlingi TaxID=43151 RepID=A0A2M4DM76_ANODA
MLLATFFLPWWSVCAKVLVCFFLCFMFYSFARLYIARCTRRSVSYFSLFNFVAVNSGTSKYFVRYIPK